MGAQVNIGSTLGFQDSRRAKRTVKPRNGKVRYERTKMTPRLLQIQECIQDRLTDARIAERLGISVGSVKQLASDLFGVTGKRRLQIQLEGLHATGSQAEGLPRMGAFE
jgi:DNA-binding NarL/FixJ family response regulator